MQSRKNGHRHIWLLSGIGEGHCLAKVLADEGWEVTVSVVNDSASLPYQEMRLRAIHIGPLQGVEGIKRVLQAAASLHNGFQWVIDATHPFAVVISSDLQIACNELDQKLLRFDRLIDSPSWANIIST